MTIDWAALEAAARAAQANAHAPYSRFSVGAALLDAEGRIHVGCNVENASYGLTVCAERNAFAGAVVDGVRRFTALLIIAPTTPPTLPCGACRQVLRELAPDVPIRALAPDGSFVETDARALLPHAFGPEDLEAT